MSPSSTCPPVPAGSLVLVTASNSLVGTHIVDALLSAGYRVRGMVRNATPNAWMSERLNGKTTSKPSDGISPFYHDRRFELFEISDLTSTEGWKSALSGGVAAIAHVFSATETQTQDFKAAAAAEMPAHTALLTAAAQTTTVQSVAFTSSTWAAFTPEAGLERRMHEWSWNEPAVKLATGLTTKLVSGEDIRDEASPHALFFAQYMALKVEVEKQVWAFVGKNQLPFTFNSILLDTVMGATLQPHELGMPSTAGMVKWAFDGQHPEVLGVMEPQWCVDTQDVGMLFAGVLSAGKTISGERLWACGDRYSWAQVMKILQNLIPERAGWMQLPDLGTDRTEVPNGRAEDILKSIKGSGWTDLEEMVQRGAGCF